MATVAEMLHEARETQKLSLNDVAEVTKIRTDHLRALEEGNYNVFMAPVFIKGFVRSLARMYKMDVAMVNAALEAELSQTKKFSEPPPLTNTPRGPLDFIMLQLSKLNWNVVAVIGSAAFVLFITVYGYQSYRRYKTSNQNPLVNIGPGVYQAKPEIHEVYLPVPTNAPRR